MDSDVPKLPTAPIQPTPRIPKGARPAIPLRGSSLSLCSVASGLSGLSISEKKSTSAEAVVPTSLSEEGCAGSNYDSLGSLKKQANNQLSSEIQSCSDQVRKSSFV